MESKALRTGLIGADGRMGRAIQEGIKSSPDNYRLVYVIEQTGSKKINDISPAGLPYRTIDQIHDDEAQVWIEFSHVEGLLPNLQWLNDPSVRGAYVLGVTGLREEHSQLIRSISKIRPVLYSPNMSIGIAVMKRIVPLLSQLLGKEMDVEVEELHHRYKEDQPSGTAYMLAQKVLEGWDVPKSSRDEHIRLHYDSMHHQRPPQTVYCVSHRRGQWIGEHNIHYSMTQEEICLSHKTLDRAALALGALSAAQWVHKQPPGLYSMDNVLDARIDSLQSLFKNLG